MAKPKAVPGSSLSKQRTAAQNISAVTNAGDAAGRTAPPKSNASGVRKKTRQPRSAAIVLTLPPEVVEKGTTYRQILNEARSKINIEDHGLSEVRLRVAQTGARIIEVRDDDKTSRADRLAEEIRSALADKNVKVSRPEKTADIRLTGLDESVTEEEVEAAVKKVTNFTGQLKMGRIRASPMGLGTVWARCPVPVASKLAAAGRLLVGWSAARVHLLASRPLQCYKCLERGHTAPRCTGEHDRSGLCYRCGKPGHTAAGCGKSPNCPVCRDQGRGVTHRCGGTACKAPIRKGRRLDVPDEPSSQTALGASSRPKRKRVPAEEAMQVEQ